MFTIVGSLLGGAVQTALAYTTPDISGAVEGGIGAIMDEVSTYLPGIMIAGGLILAIFLAWKVLRRLIGVR